jgi:hypothetical protein
LIQIISALNIVNFALKIAPPPFKDVHPSPTPSLSSLVSSSLSSLMILNQTPHLPLPSSSTSFSEEDSLSTPFTPPPLERTNTLLLPMQPSVVLPSQPTLKVYQ